MRVNTWMGRPLSELTPDELMQVVDVLSAERGWYAPMTHPLHPETDDLRAENERLRAENEKLRHWIKCLEAQKVRLIATTHPEGQSDG